MAALLCVSAPAAAQPRVKGISDHRALAFSADGDHMALGYDADGKGHVAVYSTRSRYREPVQMPALGAPLAFAGFTAGGSMVVGADTSDVLVVWTLDGHEVFRTDVRKAKKTDVDVVFAANPAAPYVAWVSRPKGVPNGTLEIARVPGGQVVTSATKVTANNLRWTMQGKHVLLGGAAMNWDTLETWRPKVPGVAETSSDGTRVVSTSPDACDGFLTIAELSNGKVLRSVPLADVACPRWVWFSHGDRGLVWISATGKGEQRHFVVQAWDERRDRQKVVKKLDTQPVAAAITPDRKMLAVTDGMNVTYIWLR